MDAAVYAVESEVEETHWWFVGRRRLFAAELARAGVARDARILDVGAGTGSTLRMLHDAGYTRTAGLDSSDDAVRFCAAKGLGPVQKGDILALPFPDASFDFVFATDILEHVDDDGRAAAEIARILVPGGKALITVPTFQRLWGLQDRRAGHKRRYRMHELLRVLRRSGLEPLRHYYFNYLLFAPIYLVRRIIDLAGVDLDSEGQVNTPLINRLMTGLFTLDIATAPMLRPPFGVSALVIVAKPR